MKNLMFSLAFMLIGSFAFANNSNLNSNQKETIEYNYVTNDDGSKTCYARFCWNVSETKRECTPWTEVPCGVTIEVEGMSN